MRKPDDHAGAAGQSGAATPKGQPTTDRYAAETAAGRQDGTVPPEQKAK